MKIGKMPVGMVLTLSLFGSLAVAAARTEKTYYAIEINGVVCGYSEAQETPLQKGGKEHIQLETNIFVMLSLLGSEFNSEIKVKALLDPKTRRILQADTQIKQGASLHTFTIEVSDQEATLFSSLRGEAKKIPITPGLIIGGDELFRRIRNEFIENQAQELRCDILEILEEEIQPSTFKKIGEGKTELAGKTYSATIVEQLNGKTGVKITYWLAPDCDYFIKFETANRKVYLSDRRVVDRIKVSNMDTAIFTKANVAIADIQAITHMKLRVKIEPTGVILAAADLNVPGQTFSGTVKNNLIEGVLEIAHAKYDGKNAPPFPAPPIKDARLRKYLQPDRFIEANDPVLKKKAKEITAGAIDSWQAATRLSQWVADNIGYAIPGGGGARKTFDIRAGECGAHSNLLAAFCRAEGIPARVVFGAMYTPNIGGGFGQHAWNEIYMGQAGWIPVDATAFEADFVDSGHIRITELKSAAANAFNGREIEVLNYKLGNQSPKAEAVDSQAFAPYLGKFSNPQGGPTLTVLEKERNLALGIPGGMVLPFSKKDEQGHWLCKLAPHVYLTFNQDEKGKVTEMVLHQVLSMPKKSAAGESGESIPKDMAPYIGKYFLAAANADFTVLMKEGGLALYDPTVKATIKLQPPGKDGGRRDEYDKNTIYFEQDGQGQVTGLKIDVADMFRRGELAAAIIESTIQVEGLEAGLKRYALLQKAGNPEVFFSESSFNQLGYRYLAAGKLNEAIAIFKLNVQAYPQSCNVYNSLGEAYMKNDQNNNAIENYKKSLRLNPKNENARKMLEKLGILDPAEK